MDYTDVIIIKGPVETLSFFSERLAETFYTELNKNVIAWDMKKPLESRHFIENIREKAVLITFNFIGLSGESQFMAEGTDGKETSVWDYYGIKKVCIMVDHPLYYRDQLEMINDCMLYCIDRQHVDFIRRYYPGKKVDFLPLAGTSLGEGGQKRDIDVFFAGNYVNIKPLEDRINMLDKDNREFCYSMIEDLKTNTGKGIDEVIEEHVRADIPDITREDMLMVTNKMMVIDLYIRSYFRQKIICNLAENGIKVHIIGKDWEKAGCKKPENLVLLGQRDSLECLRYMKRSKVSVNIMPWFKDGVHDRFFNGMAQGSVVVSDSSLYIDEIAKDDVEYLRFSLDNIQEIPDIVNCAVHREDIAKQGHTLVCSGHLWRHRAVEIDNNLKKYH